MLTTGSRTCCYKIYMLAFQAIGLLILFLIMLNFPNSSLILLVVHSIYKTFEENKMTQNMSPTLDAKKYHVCPPRAEKWLQLQQIPTFQVKHVKRKSNTPRPHIQKACDRFINCSLDLFVKG
jgi:hypothetical protein